LLIHRSLKNNNNIEIIKKLIANYLKSLATQFKITSINLNFINENEILSFLENNFQLRETIQYRLFYFYFFFLSFFCNYLYTKYSCNNNLII
jgi:predicted N-acyltransferase